MQESLEASLIRIRTTTGQIVGAGFLVGACQILTCAHVVASALDLVDDTPEKPQAPLTLDFPHVAPGQILTAHVVLWRPPRADGGDDIAGLELDSDPPPGAHAVPLAQVDDLWEHSFRVFGFPQGQDAGVWATGRLLGRQTTNWVQIEDLKETGFAVEPGFSGTPVWDPQVEAVVGMVVAAERRLNLKTAFAIPVDVLAGSWPLLASLVHPFIFLSYARADSELVTRLKTDLQSQGIQIWIDREGLQPGTLDWEEALRTAIRASRAVLFIASPNTRSSRYVRDELRIAEMYQRTVYPLWIAGTHWIDAVPLGWGTAQYIDARESHYETAIPELVDLFNKASSTPVLPSEPDFEPRNPYKGLRAFTSDDAQDFFGRDTLINELATKLQGSLASETKDQQSARLLAVVGPSGSGKSSVVMAGLLPRLRSGRLPGSEQWVYLDPIVPGTRPIEELTMALSEHLPDKSLKAIREDLEDDSARGLHLLATKLAKRPDAKVVLLIDQFEELFIQTPTEDERRHFIDLLVTATTETNGPLIVLLTLRADFYDRPMRYPLLHQLMQVHQTSVLPMTLQDLREVIEKPAALPDVRLTFEGDLVGDLLFEVQNQVGALPLLQFTLDQLFQYRNGPQLTLSAYRELGGVKGALAKQAEETYNALPSDKHRKLARALFIRLMDPGASEQDTTRRRAALSEFSLAETSQTLLLQKVADAFIAVRLLTTNEIAGTTTIEVSHEALIREWPRLAGWLREARDDIRLQQAISEDAAEWEQHNKPGDRLYRGSQLKEAQAWAERNTPSDNEVVFLRAGAALRIRNIASVMILVLLLLSTTGGIGWFLSHPTPDPTFVSNLLDNNNPGSLRYAISQASPKSTITFDKRLRGTILLSGGDLNVARDLTIRGPGSGILSISGGKSGNIIHVLRGATVTISGLTFKDSKTTNNSFIYIEGGKLILNNSNISGNTTNSNDISNTTGLMRNSGGGILNEDGVLTLNNSTVSGNTAAGQFGEGGGIFNKSGMLTLTNSAILDNTTDNAGGGIFNDGGILVLTNSIVSDNAATNGAGGGIFNGGTLTLTNSTISGNKVTGGGGGGGISNGGTLTLTNSTISGNKVTNGGNGGGIFNNGTLTLTNSTVLGNTAIGNTAAGQYNSFGGGIANEDGILTLTNSTVSGNMAIGGDGGGIFHNGINNNSILTLTNSAISDNTATNGNGGGILIQSTFDPSRSPIVVYADLTFSTIYDNIARDGGDIAIKDIDLSSNTIKQISRVKIRNSIVASNPAHPGSDISGTLTSYGYNLFQNNSGATFDSATSKQHSLDKFLPPNDLSKLFADSAKLQNNGGPTKTLALAPNSPAIDQIPLVACHITVSSIKDTLGNSTAQYTVTTDQRGMKRPGKGKDKCDIGAYESSY